MQDVYTCLLFVGSQNGKAEEAVNFYVSTFRNSEVIEINHYGPNEQEQEGTVKQAIFTIKGQKHTALDSGLEHNFTFTPAVSICVEYESNDEIERLFRELSDRGKILMPLDAYGDSKEVDPEIWTAA